MEELENIEPVDQNQNAVANITTDNMVEVAITNNAQTTSSVKDIIDLASTKKALEKEGTVRKLTEEKTEELVNDAIQKRIKAETDKVNEEVKKVKAEAEKQLAELQKSIDAKKAEAEELEAQDRKAEAFYTANKSILRCIGVRERLSLKAMIVLMFPASIVFALMQILLSPISLVGFAIEQIMNIVDAVCGKITKAGWKIALSICIIIIILGLAFGIYWVATNVVFG